MQALTLDRDLLRELLGADELRDLLDPDALATVEHDLRAPRPAPAPDGLHDLLRRSGDLTRAEIARARRRLEAAARHAARRAPRAARADRRRGAR